ncbi:MAG: hypothetical protein U1A27_02965 [Phycisphaerae bacterium]
MTWRRREHRRIVRAIARALRLVSIREQLDQLRAVQSSIAQSLDPELRDANRRQRRSSPPAPRDGVARGRTSSRLRVMTEEVA